MFWRKILKDSLQCTSTCYKFLQFLVVCVFNSPSFLKNNFTGYRILHRWIFFPLSIFNISPQPLLAYIFPPCGEAGCNSYLCFSIDEVLFVCLFVFPLPLFLFQNFFLIFILKHFESGKCRCSVFDIYPAWFSLRFLDLLCVCDVNLGKLFHYCFTYFFCFFLVLFLVFPLCVCYTFGSCSTVLGYSIFQSFFLFVFQF